MKESIMNDKNKRQMFFSSERLDYVLLETTDASLMCSWFNNLEITKYLSRGEFPMGLTYETEYIEECQKKQNFNDSTDLKLGLWHREDQKLIGTTGIHQINNRDLQGSFGIVIGEPEYWSNGYGTEILTAMLDWSFRIRGLRLITLRVLGNNPRGQRCYEKCGFVLAGNIPNSVYKDGKWVDEIIMLARNPLYE